MSEEHIVLLGDSILDNAQYVFPSMMDVTTQLIAMVAHRGWQVTRLALDGAVISHVQNVQLKRMPDDITIALLSVGGNDGLQILPKLAKAPLSTLWTFFSDFRKNYEQVVDSTCMIVPHTILCTIYQPQFTQWGMSFLSYVGVRMMNRIIRQTAEARNLKVLDLWNIFDKPEDYANAIEPGVPGGQKLVNHLVSMIQ